jgi:hypothetical protein
MTMDVLARLRLCCALSGLIVDCVSNLTQGVALGQWNSPPLHQPCKGETYWTSCTSEVFNGASA